MKPTPIATPVKAFEAIAPATNLKPITNTIHTTCPTLRAFGYLMNAVSVRMHAHQNEITFYI